jgi:hypothetical protein
MSFRSSAIRAKHRSSSLTNSPRFLSKPEVAWEYESAEVFMPQLWRKSPQTARFRQVSLLPNTDKTCRAAISSFQEIAALAVLKKMGARGAARRQTPTSAGGAPASERAAHPAMPGTAPTAPIWTAGGFFNRREVFDRVRNRRRAARRLGVGLCCQRPRKQDSRRRGKDKCQLTHRSAPRAAQPGAQRAPFSAREPIYRARRRTPCKIKATAHAARSRPR